MTARPRAWPPPWVGDVNVRPETPRTLPRSPSVVAAAFGSPAEAELVDAIRASPGYVPELSLVAEVEGAVVGHVMVSEVGCVDGDP